MNLPVAKRSIYIVCVLYAIAPLSATICTCFAAGSDQPTLFQLSYYTVFMAQIPNASLSFVTSISSNRWCNICEPFKLREIQSDATSFLLFRITNLGEGV